MEFSPGWSAGEPQASPSRNPGTTSPSDQSPGGATGSHAATATKPPNSTAARRPALQGGRGWVDSTQGCASPAAGFHPVPNFSAASRLQRRPRRGAPSLSRDSCCLSARNEVLEIHFSLRLRQRCWTILPTPSRSREPRTTSKQHACPRAKQAMSRLMTALKDIDSDRPTDQPAGAQRHHRGGPRR
jgi:hypothetical protein